jgi:hypothetical protein
MSKLTTTSARNDDPLSRLNHTPLANNIRCNTSTHDRLRLLIPHPIRQPRRIARICHGILLKRPRNRKPAVQLLRTAALICAVGAELALATDGSDPIDTSAVPDCQRSDTVGPTATTVPAPSWPAMPDAQSAILKDHSSCRRDLSEAQKPE